jgi:uncharacterized C2H2 Zn-finger protein
MPLLKCPRCPLHFESIDESRDHVHTTHDEEVLA